MTVQIISLATVVCSKELNTAKGNCDHLDYKSQSQRCGLIKMMYVYRLIENETVGTVVCQSRSKHVYKERDN